MTTCLGILLYTKVAAASYLLFFGSFYFTLIACALPHELGHALIGLAVGMRIFTVTLGTRGRILAARQVLGYDFVFYHILYDGSTIYTPRNLFCVRLRHFLAVLGGPIANGLLIVGAAAACQAVPAQSRLQLILMGVLFGNITILASSLFPRNLLLDNTRVPSDGLLLLTIPFMSRRSIKDWHATTYWYEALEALQRDDVQVAERWLAKGKEIYPDSLWAALVEGSILSHQHKYAEARDLHHSALSQPDLPAEFRAHLWNNIAWQDIMLADATLLAEADRFSQQALQEAPWLPYVRGTRGSVLIDLRRVEEGVLLVKQAFRENFEPKLKALNACYLALALARQGKLPQAHDYIAAAESFDPACPLLERTAKEVELALPPADIDVH